MGNEIKPDGWVAWHPVEGEQLLTASRSKQFCEDKLLKQFFNFDSGSAYFAKAEAYFASRDIELQRAASDNWKIRPVKLQFLDDPCEKDARIKEEMEDGE
jgi:hypothetical protein